MELKDNTVIVVLGASGDLAKKKTVRTRRCLLGHASANKVNSTLLSSVSWVTQVCGLFFG